MPVPNPYHQFNFRVLLSGTGPETELGGFSEMSGLGSSTDVTQYRDGHPPEKGGRKVLPAHTSGDITLKRGLVNSREFLAWLDLARSKSKRKRARDVTIILQNEKHAPVRRWVVPEAWPAKWTGPDFSAKGNEVAVEELVLSHEGLVLE